MKIKKFNNIWTMGLIIFGVILVGLYIIKLIFPDFIIGVAETPTIVEIGEYIDNNIWAYYLFNFITSFIILYFYCCACCRVKFLNGLDILFVIMAIALSYLIEICLPSFSFVYNNIMYIALPLVLVATHKTKDFGVFYSTATCFIVTSVAQVLSLYIRDISTLVSYPNSATYFILLIDAYIWNILLYCFYNFKRRNNDG